jgi:hypothetical protein
MHAISARPWRRNGCLRNTAAFAAIDPEFEAEQVSVAGKRFKSGDFRPDSYDNSVTPFKAPP